jgi:hypothetical protein
MNGTKEVADGDVRKDFLGGFPGDSRNTFTKEGRSVEENEMFDWLSRLLHWRQSNEVISKGTMIQFLPHDGVYVFARQKDGKTVLTILNGTSKKVSLDMNRYAEVINDAASAVDVTTGKNISLKGNLILEPRASMVLDY